MNPISHFIEKQGFVILDGALATELERKGLDLNDPLWSAKVLYEQPEIIQQTHLEYFLAGADVATTASYQASLNGFLKRVLVKKKPRTCCSVVWRWLPK